MGCPPRRRLLLLLAAVALCLLPSCRSLPTVQEQIRSLAGVPDWQIAAGIALVAIVSEDLSAIAGGILAGEEAISFAWALSAAFLGIFLPNLALYALGRMGGVGLLRHRPFRWIVSEERIVQAEELFDGHGAKMIALTRFLPGSRIPVYVAAGVLGYPWWRYCFVMAIACALWTPVLVWLAMLLGEVLIDWVKIYERYALPVLIAVLVLVWATIKTVEALATRRSRLRILSKLRGLWRKLSRKK